MKCRLGNEKQPTAGYVKSVGEKGCKYVELSLPRTT